MFSEACVILITEWGGVGQTPSVGRSLIQADPALQADRRGTDI